MNYFEEMTIGELVSHLIASRGTIVKRLDKALEEKIISPRERAIYYMRNIDWKSLEEVSKEFGVTRERIRQIESKINDKLN